MKCPIRKKIHTVRRSGMNQTYDTTEEFMPCLKEECAWWSEDECAIIYYLTRTRL